MSLNLLSLYSQALPAPNFSRHVARENRGGETSAWEVEQQRMAATSIGTNNTHCSRMKVVLSSDMFCGVICFTACAKRDKSKINRENQRLVKKFQRCDDVEKPVYTVGVKLGGAASSIRLR